MKIVYFALDCFFCYFGIYFYSFYIDFFVFVLAVNVPPSIIVSLCMVHALLHLGPLDLVFNVRVDVGIMFLCAVS